MGLSKTSSKRQVYSYTIIPQKARKASNRQPNSTSKAAVKRRTKNPYEVPFHTSQNGCDPKVYK